MKFDTVTGVEIKGKLVTKSGKDVEETFNSFQDQIDGVKGNLVRRIYTNSY